MATQRKVDAQGDVIVRGRVKSVVPFGVFVDIGKQGDALLHKQNMEPRGRLYTRGDLVSARIESIDPVSKKIALTQRKRIDLDKLMATGEDIEGRVTSVQKYGVFVDIGTKRDALLPTQKMQTRDRQWFEGDSISARVEAVDPQSDKIALTQKKHMGDLHEVMARGTEIEGRVLRVEDFGVLVDIGADRDAILRRQNVQPPGRRFFEGDMISVRIESIPAWPQRIAVTQNAHVDLNKLMATGEKKEGRVTSVNQVGIHVQIGDYKGFVQRSDMDLYPGEPIPFAKDDPVTVRVLEVEPELKLTCRVLFMLKGLQSPKPLSSALREVDLHAVRCFHSKKTKEENITLGVGVEMEEKTLNGCVKRHLTSVFDFLSSDAFEDGVREGVEKHPFSFFLPLCLDEAHFKKALPSIENCIAALATPRLREAALDQSRQIQGQSLPISLDDYRRAKSNGKAVATSSSEGSTVAPEDVCRDPKEAIFDPLQILEVLPNLMNSQVALLMSEGVATLKKSLTGYMAFHHLFLALAENFPSLRAAIERRLENFVATQEGRNKDTCPDLGEVLCLLSVSDTYAWDDVCEPVLEEAFVRHAYSAQKQFPDLATMNDRGISNRPSKTFTANVKSLRLLTLQVSFLLKVKGKHSHPGIPSCSQASCRREAKDLTYGLPTGSVVREISDDYKAVSALETYDQFFEAMRVGAVDSFDLCRWLRRAMLTSFKRGYHGGVSAERASNTETKSKTTSKAKSK